jgi:guanylate kinase
MTGTFIILIGPSGSGKDTLLEHVKEVFPQIYFPPSYSSREKRPQEKEGDPYHFVSAKSFKDMIESDSFLEWAEYSGNYYGTTKKSVVPHLQAGDVVMKELDIQGAEIIKKKIPNENIYIIFIDAGDWDVLESRITNRADISHKELEKRHGRFKKEIDFRSDADMVIYNENGKLREAKQAIENVIHDIVEA